ncbi:MAG: OmpA family protein [Prevotella sp.]|nr:OmpA family protein [Prevotella sp.]MCM1074418.1 OmpA family protein [Ruminococcus sp.]
MKVRNLYFGAAVAAVALCSASDANAQQTVFVDETVAVTEYECDPNTHYFSNWRNNWFIQLGAGINQPFVEKGTGVDRDIKSIDRKRMTVAYNFGFGRWFSPYIGFRINAIGGAMHWDNPTKAQPYNGWTRAKHVNVNFELMWDMFNSLGGVNPNRVFSIIPFAGFGGDYMWRIHDAEGNFAAASNINGKGENGIKDESWTLPVTAGIQFRFRLCKYVDFFAEARATFYGDNWNNCSYGDPIEANVAAIGGFNINFGGRGWGTFNECDYMNKIADLNNQVNGLRSELLATSQALAACEAQLPCPEPVVQKDCANAPLMTTVRFTINSAKIMPTEEVNVYNMAEWLKANPNEKVNIVGYADKDTGTAEYNLKLSERRANAVADALVNTYGISRDRLNIRFDGSDVQPYSTNDWNRIVIFTQK